MRTAAREVEGKQEVSRETPRGDKTSLAIRPEESKLYLSALSFDLVCFLVEMDI